MIPIKVLIADDHEHEREGLKHIVDEAIGLEVVGLAAYAHEAVTKTVQSQPDVVVMDLDFYGEQRDGVSAIKKIKELLPSTKIVAITVWRDRRLRQDARRSGAIVVLDKGFSKRELVDAIRTAYEGPDLPVVATPEFAPLTPRENDVLALMAEGKTYQAIALRLNISESTVKKHAGKIMRKLESENSTEAVAKAERYGLISS